MRPRQRPPSRQVAILCFASIAIRQKSADGKQFSIEVVWWRGPVVFCSPFRSANAVFFEGEIDVIKQQLSDETTSIPFNVDIIGHF